MATLRLSDAPAKMPQNTVEYSFTRTKQIAPEDGRSVYQHTVDFTDAVRTAAKIDFPRYKSNVTAAAKHLRNHQEYAQHWLPDLEESCKSINLQHMIWYLAAIYADFIATGNMALAQRFSDYSPLGLRIFFRLPIDPALPQHPTDIAFILHPNFLCPGIHPHELEDIGSTCSIEEVRAMTADDAVNVLQQMFLVE